MKINITLENGITITEQIKEKVISKKDLFITYLDDYLDIKEWFITYNGVKQPVKDYYSSYDYDFDNDYWEIKRG